MTRGLLLVFEDMGIKGFVDHRFSFCHSISYPLIYDFWIPIWYLEPAKMSLFFKSRLRQDQLIRDSNFVMLYVDNPPMLITIPSFPRSRLVTRFDMLTILRCWSLSRPFLPVYPMLPVSLDCPFIIAPSVFSDVYWATEHYTKDWATRTPLVALFLLLLLQIWWQVVNEERTG
jgi:hypothetical protein